MDDEVAVGIVVAVVYAVFWIVLIVLIVKGDKKFKEEHSKKQITDGTIRKEKNGKNYYLYYPNGKVKHELIHKTSDKWISTSFYDNGNKEIVAELYRNPYDDNKSLRFKIAGICKGFYPNGHLKFAVNYVKGVRQGKMEFYYDNGDTEMILNYVDGEPTDGLVYSSEGEVKPLTMAHINNSINDYNVGKISINVSWIKELL